MSNAIRTFIAVEISPEVRQRATELIERWQKLAEGVKWVEPENLHITIKFLGNVPSARLAEICSALEKAVRPIEPFELEIAGAGAFPNLERPRTIWLGVRQGSEQLERLAATVEDHLAEQGFPREGRRFKGHLTLGRVRRFGRSYAFVQQLQQHSEFPAGTVWVEELVVFSSQLTPKGPIYTPMAKIPLGV